MASVAGSAEILSAAQALDRYLAKAEADGPHCSALVYAVQIEARLPALKKQGSMTGFKRIIQPGHAVYRGLRFTGDNLVKTRVIARFLAHESDPPVRPEYTAINQVNYRFTFTNVTDYNGLTAYVFRLTPRYKRVGLFRGEVWLDAGTAAPLRIWGDLVKSPSIFIRSFRLVQDYRTLAGCSDPLRLLLSVRTRIVGTVEMTVWLHRAPEDSGANAAASGFQF